MHVVRYDSDAGLLTMQMSGFWTMEDVQRFTADLLATVMAIPESRRNFDVLSEAGDFPIQSQEVADALGRITDAADRMNSEGRKAIVVGTVLNKLQAQRSLTKPNVRVFLSIEEARAWLAQPREHLR